MCRLVTSVINQLTRPSVTLVAQPLPSLSAKARDLGLQDHVNDPAPGANDATFRSASWADRLEPSAPVNNIDVPPLPYRTSRICQQRNDRAAGTNRLSFPESPTQDALAPYIGRVRVACRRVTCVTSSCHLGPDHRGSPTWRHHGVLT